MIQLFNYIAKLNFNTIPGLCVTPNNDWYINFDEYRKDYRTYSLGETLKLHRQIYTLTNLDFIMVHRTGKEPYVWVWQPYEQCYYVSC